MNAKADNVKSDAPKRSIDFDAKTNVISKPKNISSSAWEVYKHFILMMIESLEEVD